MQHSYIYAHYRIWNKVKQLGSPQIFPKKTGKMNSDYSQSMERKVEDNYEVKPSVRCNKLRDYTRQNDMELMVAVAPPAFVIHPERLDATFTLVDLDPNRADVDAPQQLVIDILKD